MNKEMGGGEPRMVDGQFTPEEEGHQELVAKAINEARVLGATLGKAVRNPQLKDRLRGLAIEIEMELQKEQ